MASEEWAREASAAAPASWVAPSGGGGLAAPDPREGGTDFEEGCGWEVGGGLGMPKMERGGSLYSKRG